MNQHKRLILANKAWAKETKEIRPDFFDNLSADQKPDFLWIGCSDSRVPAEEITGAKPGEIFVHRNVANMVYHNDLNAMSVLQYAVEVLKVKHVIVCGHYGCGGVRAAASKQCFGLINQWVLGIKDVVAQNEQQLAQAMPNERIDQLVELNVKAQSVNIARAAVVQRVWQSGLPLTIHGWVFDLKTGLISELIQLQSMDDLQEAYRYDFTL